MFGVKGRACKPVSKSTAIIERVARNQQLRRDYLAARRFERRRRGERDYAELLAAMIAYQRCEPGVQKPSNLTISTVLQAAERTRAEFIREVFIATVHNK